RAWASAACRRGDRYKQCSGCPGDEWSADTRCAPGDRCSRLGACSLTQAARLSSAPVPQPKLSGPPWPPCTRLLRLRLASGNLRLSCYLLAAESRPIQEKTIFL